MFARTIPIRLDLKRPLQLLHCFNLISSHSQDQTNQPSCKTVSDCNAGTYISRDPTNSNNRICTLCPPGTYTNSSNQSPCSDCLPQQQQYQDAYNSTGCKTVGANCSSSQWTLPPTSTSNLHCFDYFYLLPVNSVTHTFTSSGSGNDYMASVNGILGGSTLPPTIVLNSSVTTMAFAFTPPTGVQFQVVSSPSFPVVLDIELLYCQVGYSYDSTTVNVNDTLNLNAYVVNGYTRNASISWNVSMATLDLGNECLHIVASSTASTAGWSASQILLVVSFLPSRRLSGDGNVYFNLQPISVAELSYSNASVSIDPGPLLLIQDTIPPTFTFCPTNIESTITNGQTSALVSWQHATATDISGVQPSISFTLLC